MAAPKGFRPPNAGKGRPKGSPNRATVELRDMILGALDAVGGAEYLQKQANKKPAAFLNLLGRTLPKDIKLGGGLKLEVNLVSTRRSPDDQLPGTGSGS